MRKIITLTLTFFLLFGLMPSATPLYAANPNRPVAPDVPSNAQPVTANPPPAVPSGAVPASQLNPPTKSTPLSAPAVAAETTPTPPPPEPSLAPAPVAPPVFEVAPATTYMPILPYGADPDASPQLLPVASNHPLENEHNGLQRAIIVVHDSSRDANVALQNMTTLIGISNASTLILAPQFLLNADIARFASHLPNQGKDLARWPFGVWEQGGDSEAKAPQKGISSFTAMDLLLIYLSDKRFFPDLNQIVIVGNGMGGDFVQRYAAFGHAPDLIDTKASPVRFIVANAASFLYFTTTRPKGGKQGFGLGDDKACPDFNTFPYGLDQLNSYAKRIGGNAVKLSYVTRNIFYLDGEKAAQGDPFPDTSCAAMQQGSDRIARFVNYQIYLDSIFGADAGKLQHFTVVPKTGYDGMAVLGSTCGLSALLGNGECLSTNPNGFVH